MTATTDGSARVDGGVRSRWRALMHRLGLGRNGDAGLGSALEKLIAETRREPGTAALGPDEIKMLFNILRNGDLRIHEIMVPRVDLVAADIESPFEDIVALFSEAAHSRLPLYRGSLDEIVGMVHVKDVLKLFREAVTSGRPAALADIQRPVLFVAPSMRAMDLLTKMRASRIHMAIVVDEYGGTDGLVTIEDLVEQIVGDIEDEHDTDDPVLIRRIGEGRFEVGARLPIEDLEAALGMEMRDPDGEEVDTVGGLVFSLVGRVPQIGERLKHPNGVRFEVVDADPRRIRRLRVYAPKPGRHG
ncbi:MAG: hemolysin family protein [Rhodothalassiaceae bacterium]